MVGFVICTLVGGCKKTTTSSTPPASAKCLISADTNTLIGNYGYWLYTFNNLKHPVAIKKYISTYGVPDRTKEIYYAAPGVVDKTITKVNADVIEVKYGYNNYASLPFKSEVYFNNTNVWGFDFYYDGKNRLVKVVNGTPINGDNEYTLHIHYNAQNNVTALEYEITTGPRVPNHVIAVSAYDDKPNPYAAIPFWKFIMPANWDNYDPEPIITR